jgi:hypothetical protein
MKSASPVSSPASTHSLNLHIERWLEKIKKANGGAEAIKTVRD